jgi:hypothetical protein
MWHEMGREEMHADFLFITLRERGHLEDLHGRGWIMPIKMDFQE